MSDKTKKTKTADTETAKAIKNLANQDGKDTGLQFDSGIITGVGVTKDALRVRKERLLKLAKKSTKDAQLITSAYWEATPGDIIRGIFRGWTNIFKELSGRQLEDAKAANDGTLVGDKKKILCAVVDTLDGIRLTGSMNAVELLKIGAPIDSDVELTCKTAGANEMKTFSLFVFLDDDEDGTEVEVDSNVKVTEA